MLIKEKTSLNIYSGPFNKGSFPPYIIEWIGIGTFKISNFDIRLKYTRNNYLPFIILKLVTCSTVI
jgi:hypothetical protein